MVRRGRASSAVEQDPPRHVLETFILVWLDGSTSMEERQLLDIVSVLRWRLVLEWRSRDPRGESGFKG